MHSQHYHHKIMHMPVLLIICDDDDRRPLIRYILYATSADDIEA